MWKGIRATVKTAVQCSASPIFLAYIHFHRVPRKAQLRKKTSTPPKKKAKGSACCIAKQSSKKESSATGDKVLVQSHAHVHT